MGRGTGETQTPSAIQRRVALSCQPATLGADDYESGLGEGRKIIARRGGDELGRLEYSIRADHLRIIHIEVDEDERRRGIGTSLVEELLKQHPALNLTTGGFTDDGEVFFEKLGTPIEEERDPLLDDE